RRAFEVRSGQCVADRILQLTVPLVPRARSLVYDAYQIGLHLSQPGLEDIREELVIAIPLSFVVERNDEQIATLECLQHRAAVLLFGNGITPRTSQTLEHRGLEQE